MTRAPAVSITRDETLADLHEARMEHMASLVRLQVAWAQYYEASTASVHDPNRQTSDWTFTALQEVEDALRAEEKYRRLAIETPAPVQPSLPPRERTMLWINAAFSRCQKDPFFTEKEPPPLDDQDVPL